MSIVRISHALAVTAITGVLALTAYSAQAGGAAAPALHPGHHAAAHPVRDTAFVAPTPHKYGANGMRMGLHCETHDIS
jgi:hypothetical protein